ncbi:MAG: 50S ribosomal protein L10 [Candidatus Saccharimonadales bacterium]
MALSKDKKQQVVVEVSELLAGAKMTVVSKYAGTSVKAMQQLRREARSNGTTVKVFKNRLVKRALADNKLLADTDTSQLIGMLLYSFNNEDEVAPAKAVADFAKTNPSLEFVGAITADGRFLTAEEVKSLAALPSRQQLIAEVLMTLQSPVNGVTSALAGNLHGMLDAIAAKAA